MGTWEDVTDLLIDRSGRVERIEFRPDRKQPVGLLNPRFILRDPQIVADASTVRLTCGDTEVYFTHAAARGVEIAPGKTLLLDSDDQIAGFVLAKPVQIVLDLGAPGDWSHARELIRRGEPVQHELQRLAGITDDDVPIDLFRAALAKVPGRAGRPPQYTAARDVAITLAYALAIREAKARGDRDFHARAVNQVQRKLPSSLPKRKTIEAIVRRTRSRLENSSDLIDPPKNP